MEVYPAKNDPQRRSFSHAIERRIPEKGCADPNLQCDPETALFLNAAVEINFQGQPISLLDALQQICNDAGLDWETLRNTLNSTARLHIETY